MPRLHPTVAVGMLVLLSAGCALQGAAEVPGGATSRSLTETVAAVTIPPAPPPPPPPPAAPFDLVVADIGIRSMDNAEILGVAETAVDEAVVREAVEAARGVLAAYLDAQFVDAATRFSATPLELLLGEEAAAGLDPDARRGLGDVRLPVGHTATGPASAVADVLVAGATVHAVTFTYQAELTVALADGATAPVVQHGRVVFAEADGQLRVQAADVILDLPTTAAANR